MNETTQPQPPFSVEEARQLAETYGLRLSDVDLSVDETGYLERHGYFGANPHDGNGRPRKNAAGLYQIVLAPRTLTSRNQLLRTIKHELTEIRYSRRYARNWATWDERWTFFDRIEECGRRAEERWAKRHEIPNTWD